MNRRRFIRIGSITVASAAVLAACDGDDDDGGGDTSAGRPDTGDGTDIDVTILRTASSLEELAIFAYQRVSDSGLVTTTAIADTVMLFEEQHREHAALFQGATEEAGGEPFTEPNPALLEQLQRMIDALTNEAGVARLAYDLESVAAQTYQASVGKFTDPTLNQGIMTVGGVEARHAAALAQALGQLGVAPPPVPVAFQVTDDAVEAGTGL